MGERIAAIRQAINVREGLTPKDFEMPGRTIGVPPLKDGPTANITIDIKTRSREFYEAMDWDYKTGKPGQKNLLELGMDDVALDLWP